MRPASFAVFAALLAACGGSVEPLADAGPTPATTSTGAEAHHAAPGMDAATPDASADVNVDAPNCWCAGGSAWVCDGIPTTAALACLYCGPIYCADASAD